MKKDNRDIEKRIKREAEQFTPEIWDNVAKDIKNKKGSVVDMPAQRAKLKFLRVASTIAAAFVLVFFVTFAITNYDRAEKKTVSTLYIEVNPQIELSLNTYNKVVKATPKNEDGKKVIGTMELENTSLDVALNAIFGSMVKNGYLNESANSVLLGVKNDDQQDAIDLRTEVLREVQNISSYSELEIATIIEIVSDDDATVKDAKENNISVAKAVLVHEVINKASAEGQRDYKFEELAKLSINELNFLLHKEPKTSGESKPIYGSGAISENKYIGTEKVKEIVFKQAKVDPKDVRDFEAELDYDYGKMIYEVEFEVGATEYDYELDAVSGEILKSFAPTTKPQSGTNENSSKPNTESNTNISSKPATSSPNIDELISPEKALEYALNHAGVSKSVARDVDVEIDDDRKDYHYDVEFWANGYEYEYEVDAVSGKILKSHKEFDD